MIEVANAKLEEAKRSKETTEQDLKEYEVELAMNVATIQTLETRFPQSDRIWMLLRKFQESVTRKIHEVLYNGKEDPKLVKEEVTEGALGTLEDILAGVVSQTTKVEEECKSEQNIQKQVQQSLIDCERKVFLMEEMLQATKALQDLTRYPFQDCDGY
ncbi:hypothetical protein CerSpe_270040 [Prunus speciosa]